FSTSPPSTELYTLSLHDALPILTSRASGAARSKQVLILTVISFSIIFFVEALCARFNQGDIRLTPRSLMPQPFINLSSPPDQGRSEEHTSELQSRENLVCRLLLE